MAQIHKLEHDIELKCSAYKFYGMFTLNVTQLPKYLPKIYDSIKVIEGDGTSVGTVRLWKYALEGSHLSVKERTTTSVNKETGGSSITFNTFEGEVMNSFKTFVVKLAVTPKGTDGNKCLVKWCLEFEKVNEEVPTPTAYINLLDRISKELAPQLLKQG
ncbi:Bet v I domain [Macleaya cordata]|uniref:Bet v I domain n=1 Tax=Macleaya cordata TaxID=56857 RepID=A0A200PU48_MACCD|nr:Bet v I domain [Macleaya cordata]